MTLTLAQIAQLVHSHVPASNRDVPITDAAILRDALPGHITFVDDAKHAEKLAGCSASAALVPADVDLSALPSHSIICLPVQNVRDAFTNVTRQFRQQFAAQPAGVSPAAHVDPSARIHPTATVAAGASIGAEVEIGAGCVVHSGVCIGDGCRLAEGITIYPHAVLYERTVCGARTIIHANAVVGGYGFGYQSDAQGHTLCPQLGWVEIGCDVEIGAASTIDRGTYGPTTIGDGTKIDNLVQIGHNCRIGRHNLLCSQVGIAGSCSTGDFVVMAGQVGIRDHVDIGEHVMIGAKAGVPQNLDSHQQYLGTPATPARQQMQILFSLQKLPELRKQVRRLQEQLEQLQSVGLSQADTPQRRDVPDSQVRRSDAA